MKGTKFLFFLIAFMMFGVIHAEIASGTCGKDGDNITWTLSDDGTLTLSGSGEMENYYGNQPWRVNINQIKKIEISEGISNIGRGAFEGYNKLASVTIPTSVTSIGVRAFADCRSLASVNIPNSIVQIGGSAFVGCDNMRDIYYSSTIDEWLKMSGLSTAAISSDVCVHFPSELGEGNYVAIVACGLWKNDDDYTLWELCDDGTLNIRGSGEMYRQPIGSPLSEYGDNIKKAFIDNGFTSVGVCAFFNCSNLTSVTIPASVTKISDSAFYGCIYEA